MPVKISSTIVLYVSPLLSKTKETLSPKIHHIFHILLMGCLLNVTI